MVRRAAVPQLKTRGRATGKGVAAKGGVAAPASRHSGPDDRIEAESNAGNPVGFARMSSKKPQGYKTSAYRTPGKSRRDFREERTRARYHNNSSGRAVRRKLRTRFPLQRAEGNWSFHLVPDGPGPPRGTESKVKVGRTQRVITHRGKWPRKQSALDGECVGWRTGTQVSAWVAYSSLFAGGMV
jgi:hypothetical protein